MEKAAVPLPEGQEIVQQRIPVLHKPAVLIGHANQTAIEAMASRGIITGSDGVFLPDNTMTRAEFAAIVVRALGLTSETAAQAHSSSAAPNRL